MRQASAKKLTPRVDPFHISIERFTTRLVPLSIR